MFKAAKLVTQSTKRLSTNRNKAFIASASTRFQKANSHDFTIRVSFPIQNIEEFQEIVKSKGANEVETTTYTNTYFDCVPKQMCLSDELPPKDLKYEMYTLSKKDIWLRTVDNFFLCQTPFKDYDGRTHLQQPIFDRIPHFEEQRGEKEIRRELNLQHDVTREAREGIKLPTLQEDLRNRMGVVPYATFKCTQRVFGLPNHFVMDMYSADFGYDIADIQTVVKNGTELELSKRCNELIGYLCEIGVNMDNYPFTRTLILEWIARNNKEHYQALIDSGIVPDPEALAKHIAEEQLKIKN